MALGTLGFNPVLTVGEASETVTVTAAPPVLNTTDATVGLVMENSTYSALPLQMNNAQRDPTAFASLAPGAQAGTRLPIIGGTSNYLGQLYLDGMPAETINQQGDNRLVSQAVSCRSPVDQFQVVTSTPSRRSTWVREPPTSTVKSGGTGQYHGQASDFVRNTMFDAWNFTSKLPTQNSCGRADGSSVEADRAPERAFTQCWREGSTYRGEAVFLRRLRPIPLSPGRRIRRRTPFRPH